MLDAKCGVTYQDCYAVISHDGSGVGLSCFGGPTAPHPSVV